MKSRQVCLDDEREERIIMEIVVDAYGPEERAMGWYYYLENELSFPFQAACMAERAVSPLQPKERVEVLGMAPEDECMREVFVLVRFERRKLAVPLAQLKPAPGCDDDTKTAVGDWHYWVERRYEY
jgi:hypothetical protein